MSELIQMVRTAGPYLAIELLLPGGSVIALLLWIFRRGPGTKLALRRRARLPARRHVDSAIPDAPSTFKEA